MVNKRKYCLFVSGGAVEVLPDEETLLLTDDYNPVETLTIPHSEAWRKVSMKGFSQAVLYQE